ncbi:ComEA family DNA-binding protein [Streptomyces sp. NBC_00588]|nr:ComEA family DNA-binding protein [Streptomyces sp. NBC_00588]WUB38310.1 ComEA family DNA-binding protein [Streptomyces sp. NBC_00588]
MALRSHSVRTATVSSGPGRGHATDGRVRGRRPPGRGGGGVGSGAGAGVRGGARVGSRGGARVGARVGRRRHVPAEEVRRRAEVLFPGRRQEWRESGAGPGDAGSEGSARPARSAGSVDPPVGEPGGVGEVAPPELPVQERGRAELPEEEPGRHVEERGRAETSVGERGDPGLRPPRPPRPVPGLRAPSDAWRARAGLALRERMPLWLQTRCGLERRSVLALSVLLVVAAVFAVQYFWTGRTQSVRAPEVVRAAAPFGERKGSGAPEPEASARTPGVSGTAGAQIVVDVGGKVRDPGIHRLPAGSRVVDALRAAGGVRPGTKLDGLNRARFLVDGEQVIVGAPAAPAPAAAGGGSSGAAAGGAPAAPIVLSTATVDQLDTLPGVGPVLAQHIVDYRTRHGGFRSVDELREVNGIGDRRFADLRDLVRP